MFTNQEVIDLQQAIANVGNLSGAKFVYAMARNSSKIDPLSKALSQTLDFTKEYKEYDGKRVELAKRHAKIKDGKPEIRPMADNPRKLEYVIENQENFDKELEALKKQYKSAIDVADKQIEDFNSLLKSESDFIPYMITKEEIPLNITAAQLTGIFKLVKEEEEVKKEPKSKK